MNVLVTGANGFLGSRTVPAMLARMHRVRALVRPGADVEPFGWPGSVEVVRADLGDPAAPLDDAVRGMDAVVHLAAIVSGPAAEQRIVAVEGTERLLRAMARARCRRLVLCSSFSVYDYGAVEDTLDEESPIHSPSRVAGRDGYTIAKWEQEGVVRRIADGQGLDLTVMRPGFIWGAGHTELAGLGIRAGRLWVVVGPSSRLPLTHVDNCADAFATVVADPRAFGQTFNVLDGPGETAWRFLAERIRRTGPRALRVPVPYGLARLLVGGVQATLGRAGGRLPSFLHPDRFESRFRPLRFECTKLRRSLGWTPPLDHAGCLERTYGGVSPTAGGVPGIT